jgi:hypothetical protein
MRTTQRNPFLWFLLLLTAWAYLAAPQWGAKTASGNFYELESASGGLVGWEAAPRLSFGGLAEEDASVPLVGAKGAGEVVADAGSVKGVNPTGSTQNCTDCVAVVDNLLATGKRGSALPRATPVPFAQLGKMYGTTFSGWRTQQSIESSLLASGNGARAVIYGTDGATGHAWNAVVQNGRVIYIEGQIGASGAANFQSFSHFQFGVLP